MAFSGFFTFFLELLVCFGWIFTLLLAGVSCFFWNFWWSLVVSLINGFY